MNIEETKMRIVTDDIRKEVIAYCKKDIIEIINTLYRERLKETSDLEREIRDIKEKLKDKTIPYNDYCKLQSKKIMLERDDYPALLYSAKGMSKIREAILDYDNK